MLVVPENAAASKKVAVFPCSGGVGSSTAKHLIELGLVPAQNMILIARYPDKPHMQMAQEAGATVRRADYDDDASLEHAFDGADVLFIVSYASIQHQQRLDAHRRAIEAARKSGVKHVVYTSLGLGGGGNTSVTHVMQAHLSTEAYLAETAAADASFTYTAVREGLYTESIGLYLCFIDPRDDVEEFDIPIPHNGAKPGLSWVKRDELGEGSARIIGLQLAAGLQGDFPYRNDKVILTGPKEWSLQETCEALERVTGKKFKIREVSKEEYASLPRVLEGMWYEKAAAQWAKSFDGLRAGEGALVTPTLKELLGREPEDHETTLRAMFAK